MNNLSKSLLLQQILLLVFMFVWFFLSVNPYETGTWLAENILLMMGFIFLIESHQNSNFSNISYIFIFIFACLQTVGSHYTYALVPLGFEVQDYFNLERNHYDRWVHLCFGLLLALPVKEYFLDKIIIKNNWLYLTTFTLIFFGFGGLYEVFEWLYALIVNTEQSTQFLGEQGDQWDAQKDIALAGFGAFITLSLHLMFSKKISYYD